MGAKELEDAKKLVGEFKSWFNKNGTGALSQIHFKTRQANLHEQVTRVGYQAFVRLTRV